MCSVPQSVFFSLLWVCDRNHISENEVFGLYISDLLINNKKTCVTKNWERKFHFKKKSFDFTHMVIYDIIFLFVSKQPLFEKRSI